ncbi:MAG: TonB-dependent receptor [Lacunisphaera sp.]
MSFRFISLFLLIALAAAAARAQTAPAPDPAAGTVELDRLVITGQLDQAREAIVPSLGATSYLVTDQQIETVAQGSNAPFNQILLRIPGVAADSAPSGGVHVRGEHANLQYRINDVLLPEGISGFGVELDPRFIDSLQLVTGALPAQYGFRTAGIVDIHTRNGALADRSEVSLYGGSHDTVNPSFSTGGSAGPASYFVSGGYNHNDLGIENPTSSTTAIHDTTDQWKLFSYASRLLDSGSRLSVMLSGSGNDFQVPNTPGLAPGTSPDGNQWTPGTFDSAGLDENQRERNYYGIVTYQKSAGDLNYQLSAFARESDVHFLPDVAGDLFFNGVASDVARRLRSAGLQLDGSYGVGAAHTVRGGASVLAEGVSADATTTVFPVDADGNPTGPSFAVANHDRLHGTFAGAYLQDEWKLTPTVTLNYGARFDVFSSSFDDENQLSPRLGLIWQPTANTTLHAGYARYFTPPAVENVSRSAVAQFDGTSNAAAIDQDDPVRAERANYFDLGVSQKLAPGLQVGLDAYYKRATNQLDDGLFGQTLILSSFNYARGEVYGVELTTSYTRGGFSAYANLARSQARGKDWNSAQFLFDPADLAYVHDHWISLDHDQTLSGSAGASYRWKQGAWSTLLFADVIYGSGLRNDATAPDGSTIPNGASVPSYATLNFGAARGFKTAHGEWQARLDVVNAADKSYELRDGSGVGVNAAQYGARRGFFGSVSYKF